MGSDYIIIIQGYITSQHVIPYLLALYRIVSYSYRIILHPMVLYRYSMVPKHTMPYGTVAYCIIPTIKKISYDVVSRCIVSFHTTSYHAILYLFKLAYQSYQVLWYHIKDHESQSKWSQVQAIPVPFVACTLCLGRHGGSCAGSYS